MKVLILVLLSISLSAYAITESQIRSLADKNGISLVSLDIKKMNEGKKKATVKGLSPSWKVIGQYLQELKKNGVGKIKFDKAEDIRPKDKMVEAFKLEFEL